MVRLAILALVLAWGSATAATGLPNHDQSLNGFLDQLSSSFINDPATFQQLAGGPTVFDRDEVKGNERLFGRPRIVAIDERKGTAVLLLSAAPTVQGLENSGDRTSYSSRWSGLYPAVRGGAGWRLGNRIPFGINRILSHDIKVQLDPRSGLSVHDVMGIDVASKTGFAAMLNMSAHLAKITTNGKPVSYDFQNGLLWIDLPRGRRTVSLDYDIVVERPEKSGNSSAFTLDAGHIRNQYFWHPFFGFSDEHSRADFKIEASIPARYQLALDIPQSDRVQGDRRIVEGSSRFPTAAISFAYDSSWRPTTFRSGNVALTLFTNNDFAPSQSEIRHTFDDAVGTLTTRFGPPPINQMKIVQARKHGDRGWHFLSNQAIFAGAVGGAPTRADDYPVRAFLGHEISHLWTHPTGPATNFLMEGWATYAESLLLEQEFGPDVARQFWRDQARLYANRPEAQSTAMDNDVTNAGVSYFKGAWLLHMIEELVSTPVFNAAIRRYARAPADHASYEDFLAAFGDKGALVERFARPWYTRAGLPSLEVSSASGSVILTQTDTQYWLPNLTVRLIHADGSSLLKTINVEGTRTLLPTDSNVVAVEIDPFDDYLLRKRIFDLPTRTAIS